MGKLHIMGHSGTDGQPSSSAQAVVTATIGAAAGTTAATTTTPWGFATSTQADYMTELLNECRADVAANTALVNELRRSLVDLELIKGSA
jgi:hypothetical protein